MTLGRRAAKPQYRVTVRGADNKTRTIVYFSQTRANDAARLHRDRGRQAIAWHVASGMPKEFTK